MTLGSRQMLLSQTGATFQDNGCNAPLCIMLQDCLKLTPEQREEIIRLRATSLAKQAENQAQWHQLCSAIAQVTSVAHCHVYTPEASPQF